MLNLFFIFLHRFWYIHKINFISYNIISKTFVLKMFSKFLWNICIGQFNCINILRLKSLLVLVLSSFITLKQVYFSGLKAFYTSHLSYFFFSFLTSLYNTSYTLCLKCQDLFLLGSYDLWKQINLFSLLRATF